MEFKTDSKGTLQSLISQTSTLTLLCSLLILYFLSLPNYFRIQSPFHYAVPEALCVMYEVFDKKILVRGEEKKKKETCYLESRPNSALITANQGKLFTFFKFPYLTKPCVQSCPRDLRVWAWIPMFSGVAAAGCGSPLHSSQRTHQKQMQVLLEV